MLERMCGKGIPLTLLVGIMQVGTATLENSKELPLKSKKLSYPMIQQSTTGYLPGSYRREGPDAPQCS